MREGPLVGIGDNSSVSSKLLLVSSMDGLWLWLCRGSFLLWPGVTGEKFIFRMPLWAVMLLLSWVRWRGLWGVCCGSGESFSVKPSPYERSLLEESVNRTEQSQALPILARNGRRRNECCAGEPGWGWKSGVNRPAIFFDSLPEVYSCTKCLFSVSQVSLKIFQ